MLVSQYIEGIGTTHLTVLNFVVRNFESWQISQGFVKSINYKLWNLGQRKFITVHLANMIKVFSVLIWWCLTTVHKEWRFSLEITDVIEHIWKGEVLYGWTLKIHALPPCHPHPSFRWPTLLLRTRGIVFWTAAKELWSPQQLQCSSRNVHSQEDKGVAG